MSGHATFGLGCFWDADEYFEGLPGVISTTAGYTGGQKDYPTYNSPGEHIEAVEIDFDPSIISYEELLEHFWRFRDPTDTHSHRFSSVIFTHGFSQHRKALKSRSDEKKKYKKPIMARIEHARTFWPAETYNQNYFSRLKV